MDTLRQLLLTTLITTISFLTNQAHAQKTDFQSWALVTATANGINKGPEGGFDRDRFFFGPLFRAGPGRYEIGYLGEYARQFGNDSRMINALLMSAQFSF